MLLYVVQWSKVIPSSKNKKCHGDGLPFIVCSVKFEMFSPVCSCQIFAGIKVVLIWRTSSDYALFNPMVQSQESFLKYKMPW